MTKFLHVLLVLFCFNSLCFSQGEFVVRNKKKIDKIKFRLISNLIIIPVEINGVELDFILDTGVSKPIIFNFLNITDSLSIKNTEKIFLRGLGEGEPVEALKSEGNVFKIGDAINVNQDLFAVFDANLNFAPRLGFPIHGIIGFDFFKDLVVEINYASKYIKLYSQDVYKKANCKSCETFNLEFYNKKPYLNAGVKIKDTVIPVKLLIDSGGSDSVWLFEDRDLGIVLNQGYFEDFLGHGLSGSVYGKRSRISEFHMKRFVIKNANTAFPDSTSISTARNFKDRNGSLAGNILKRFNMVVNYSEATLLLKKNRHFNDAFSYNKSGIELEHNGIRLVKELRRNVSNSALEKERNSTRARIVFNTDYKISIKPAYTIVELRQDSPAEKAGLLVGDVFLRINGKEVHGFSLQDIMLFFYDEAGKRIKLKIDRDGKIHDFQFKLERLF